MFIIPANAPVLNDINSLFSLLSTNSHSQNDSLITQYHDFFKSLELPAFTFYLKSLDDSFANSSFRKMNYHIKGFRKRTFITLSGAVTLDRRYYKHKSKGTYYSFIDTFLDFKPYQRIANEVKIHCLESLLQCSYQQAGAPFNLSKTTIMNVLRQLNKQLCSPPDLKVPITATVLYIQADEDHVASREKGRRSTAKIIEHVTIFSHKEWVSKKRYALKNKVVFTRNYKESLHDFFLRIDTFIQNNFFFKKLICFGDGAPWIKSLADSLNAIFILDRFHFEKALNSFTFKKPLLKKIALNYLLLNKKEAFSLIGHYLKDTLNTAQFKSFKYLHNQWIFIRRNFKLSFLPGCSAEGLNSHYFASRLSSRPKAFKDKSLYPLAFICSLRAAGLNIKDCLKQHIFPPKKNFLDFSIFENITPPSSLPLLRFATNVPLRKFASYIAH